RLPVRVALDPEELARHPLRVGLSMVASISATESAAPVEPVERDVAGPPAMTRAKSEPLVQAPASSPKTAAALTLKLASETVDPETAASIHARESEPPKVVARTGESGTLALQI